MQFREMPGSQLLVVRAARIERNNTGWPTKVQWSEPSVVELKFGRRSRRDPGNPYFESTLAGPNIELPSADYDNIWDVYENDYGFAVQVIAIAKPGLNPQQAIAHALENPGPGTIMDFNQLKQRRSEQRGREIEGMSASVKNTLGDFKFGA